MPTTQPQATWATEREDMIEDLRATLIEWEKYARTMADAGLIASPTGLMAKTVAILDRTAC